MMEDIINDKNISSIRNTIKDTKLEHNVFLWGGYIRDFYFGIVPKDIDIVVVMDDFESPIPLLSSGLKVPIEEIIQTSPITFQFKYNNIPVDARVLSKPADVTLDKVLLDNIIDIDFTINSLFVDVNGDGTVLDITGYGLYDLKYRIIRLCNPSLKETFDAYPNRMVRVVRLSCLLDLKIPGDIMTYIRENSYIFNFIEFELIIEEYNRILKSKNSVDGIHLLNLLNINPTTLDRGYLYFGKGWFAIEPGHCPKRVVDGEKFRWTSEKCEIYVNDTVKAFKMKFVTNSYFDNYSIKYYVNDDPSKLFSIPNIKGTLNSFIFDTENVKKITIISDVFVPDQWESNKDTRKLGVYLKSTSVFTESGEINIPIEKIPYLI